MNRLVLCALGAAALAGCGDMARLPEGASIGPSPQLPAPTRRLIPTVHIAEAASWPAGQQPTAPSGWRVTALATGLSHPRWLHVLPNGDLLVAESNKPPAPAGTLRPARLGHEEGDGPRRRRRAQRRPHHAAARRRRRWRGRDPQHAAGEPAVAVRHGAGGRPAVRGECRCDRAVPVPRRRRRASRPRRRRSPTCRRASTTTGPRTSSPAATAASCMRRWAPTATWARTASTPRKGVRRSGRWMSPPAPSACSRAGCATRTGWPGSRRRARCGPW